MTLVLKLCFWLSLLCATAAAHYINVTNDNGTIPNADLKEYTYQMKLMNRAIEYLGIKVDKLDQRLQIEFTKQRRALLLDNTRCREAQCQTKTPLSTASSTNMTESLEDELCEDSEEIVSSSLSSAGASTCVDSEEIVPSSLSSAGASTSAPAYCADALSIGRPSDILQLHLPAEFNLKPFYAYCLQDARNGSAWTIVQRRMNGSITFERDWADYKRGFGNLNGEFFIGLDHLHAMTHSQMHELRIEMEDFEGARRFAAYERFAITDESLNYAMNILGAFSGDAGDSLRKHAGQEFSTRDADHDRNKHNCAVAYTGAWWYNSCYSSNLNGQYFDGGKDTKGKGIHWNTWHHNSHSLKYVHMAIRPVKFN